MKAPQVHFILRPEEGGVAQFNSTTSEPDGVGAAGVAMFLIGCWIGPSDTCGSAFTLFLI